MRLSLALLLLIASGCTALDRGASRALADADAHAAHGDYPAAMAAYERYLARYPDDDSADRARVTRAVMADLMAARVERNRLAAREAELRERAAELTERQPSSASG